MTEPTHGGHGAATHEAASPVATAHAGPKRRRPILVDGANVAHEMRRNGRPELGNLWRIERALVRLGYRPILVIDAALRWKLSESDARHLGSSDLSQSGAYVAHSPSITSGTNVVVSARSM
jgi:hypothetical protein